MSFEYTIYGDVRFELSYTDEQLGEKVLSFIESKKGEGSFTYLSLCSSLIDSAREDKLLKGARDGVYYQSPQLIAAEYTRVSRILWRFILLGKVFVDFYNNEYVARDSSDTTFGIISDTAL